MVGNTKGEETTEAANPGRQLADAAHELGAGIDVDAGALVRHALIPSAGGGAGHGDAPHRLARLREAEAVRVARAPASCGGGRGRGPVEEAEDAGGVHWERRGGGSESAWRERDAAADAFGGGAESDCAGFCRGGVR